MTFWNKMYIQPTVKNVPSDCGAPAAASSALRTENSKSEIRPNFRSSSVLKTTFQNLRRKQDKNRKICKEIMQIICKHVPWSHQVSVNFNCLKPFLIRGRAVLMRQIRRGPGFDSKMYVVSRRLPYRRQKSAYRNKLK